MTHVNDIAEFLVRGGVLPALSLFSKFDPSKPNFTFLAKPLCRLTCRGLLAGILQISDKCLLEQHCGTMGRIVASQLQGPGAWVTVCVDFCMNFLFA